MRSVKKHKIGSHEVEWSVIGNKSPRRFGFIVMAKSGGCLRCNFPQTVFSSSVVDLNWEHPASALLLAKNILSQLSQTGLNVLNVDFTRPSPLTQKIATRFVEDFLDELPCDPDSSFEIGLERLSQWCAQNLLLSA